jgi:hypothetical protein
VLAPRSRLRALVIPAPPEPDEHCVIEEKQQVPAASAPARPRRVPWAELLRRVFRSEVDRCSCGGRLKIRPGAERPARVAFWAGHHPRRSPGRHLMFPTRDTLRFLRVRGPL